MYISANEDFNQIENLKCHMFDLQLIPLDRITIVILNLYQVHFRKTKLKPVNVEINVKHIYNEQKPL